MIEWVANGLPPSEFWGQTPRSFVAIMDGCTRAAKRRTDLSLSQAWHTEAFSRMEHRHFKGWLNKALAPKPRKRKQTPEEMFQILQQFHAGGAPMNIREVN